MAQKKIYQFKVALRGIKPMIWRRVQVPVGSTFGDLHYAINNAMGWSDTHLHEFTVINPKYCEEELIGTPDDDNPFADRVREEHKTKIKPYLPANKKFEYLYDFGDGWEHIVTFEGEFVAQPDVKYPKCIAGKRACPPEDVGGTWGYERVVELLAARNKMQQGDPAAATLSEDDKSLLEWLNPDYDPEWFDPEEAFFYEEDPLDI